jgi:hypothetical protein
MGVWGKELAVDNSTLDRLRRMKALSCLQAMGIYVKVDQDYLPTTANTTQRVHVSAAGNDWELLVDGPKFYDTRAKTGGGGAVDLVMHLWCVPFKKAVRMLAEAGV